MLDTLLANIAPHHCYGCGKTGALLCDNCKYDIMSEPFSGCVACGQLAPSTRGLCRRCKVDYQRAWCVGERRDVLRSLIDDYKFMNTYAAYRSLAALLDSHLPELPSSTIIVSTPTVASHIRERGYDHMLLIARELGRRRRVPVSQQLERVTTTKQRDASARTRERQAKEAFRWRGEVNNKATYLILDDVVTTGATLKYAASTLREAGASTIWVGAICRQPLD